MASRIISTDFRLMGFRCEMSFDLDDCNEIKAVWTPDMPKKEDFESRRTMMKFLERYGAARNEFLAEISNALGAEVIVVD